MINDILSEYGESIFTTISRLANKHDAIDLGQGFPGSLPPENLLRRLQSLPETVGNHQYAPSTGVEKLRGELADFYETVHGLSYDPGREITVTTGATEAIHAALVGLIDEGDEVVVFEPAYDQYVPVARRAGADVRILSLRPEDFGLPLETVKETISARTQLLILNHPHNPTGKIFERDALVELVELAEEYDVVLLGDEVYEHLYFERSAFESLAAIPGARDRTLRFGSAGKTFDATGWKIGWAMGPPSLTEPLRMAHQFSTYCASTPLQVALGDYLETLEPDSYFRDYRSDYAERRTALQEGFTRTPFDLEPNDGTYFSVAEYTADETRDDQELVRWMIKEIGVAGIPLSSFYRDEPAGPPRVRLSFCKERDDIRRAIRRIREYFG